MITEDTVLLYEDENHIRSYQALRSTWAEVGKQKQIPTYGYHVRVTLFGVVNVLDGDVFVCSQTCVTPKLFFLFYKKNWGVIQISILMFLPPYSPHLHSIERLWKWMKESVIANRFHKNKNEIQKSIDSFLEGIKDCTEQVLQRIGCLPEMSKC
ncbi:transposase [Aneurinibacillus thermoaerophilus]|uniref:transposase n=1 Tax=Aneurinibacillus thermoaerophilus TaxID=143495 RepID=UPI002E1DA0B0|nr:transposase [Aneurinibacillus thermoaerophilus]MED0766257.1 transposase [Aneurinibacillus thermoaerophilus]